LALTVVSLDLVKQLIEKIAAQPDTPNHIVSLGYPDLLVSVEQIGQIFGEEYIKHLKFHPDSEKIIKWHGYQKVTDKIVEAEHFFSLLDFQLSVIDINASRGNEIILDLNDPCPTNLHQKFGLVIDAGTLEHCFNIGQAFKNLAHMSAQNGFVFQSNPLNWFNHGFYNLNPTLYFDFYCDNGFTMEMFKLMNNDLGFKVWDAPAYDAFRNVPDRSSVMFVAQRTTIQKIIYPIQHKYKLNPNLHG